MGHSMADPIHGHYRTKEELEEHKLRDPIEGLRARLLDAELITDEAFASMRAAIDEEIQDALDFADQNEDPPLDDLYTHVYTD